MESIEIRWPSGEGGPMDGRGGGYGIFRSEGEAKLVPLRGFVAGKPGSGTR